jgi:pSer/pThr/pTyr-binding forkhead associated (FHA) protein
MKKWRVLRVPTPLAHARGASTLHLVATLKLEFLGRRDRPPFFITQEVTTIGRAAENDVVFCDADEDRVVSGRHCRIERRGAAYVLMDLGASNKLLVNDREVGTHTLQDGDVMQVGRNGPRVRVLIAEAGTMGSKALRDSTRLVLLDKLGIRKYRLWLAVAVLAAGGLAAAFLSRGSELDRLAKIEEQLRSLEGEISAAGVSKDKLKLIARLNEVGLEREKLLANLAPAERPKRSFVEEQVIYLMRRFGETRYVVPQIFVERVAHFVRYYSEDVWGRREIELGMKNLGDGLARIKAIFEARKLPAELAYIAFVESKFDPRADNATTGARGMWQIRPSVGREHGLVVDEKKGVDERFDAEKSTRAARSLLLNLIAIYGVRSFMLVLAAYNAGDAAIRNRLKRLDDPIEQRDFWTLVRLGHLRNETNEYIPKFIAATIVFEHLERFRFARPAR